ncbi:S-adenosyl-l-methionine hydroxide adenosyltransferase family protein [Thalassomonas sp. M1454]|uniref:SAM hydrolase/SAM-dependent halogenase family protein n=1 Tax=Thalassomonas sp. M1454 TaxID=2594477 RepID=UPI0011816770|nr:S-adenosyl-l-methionine hydroxide adenosyltransferase family protein [Thalassomonas sp. M1454]TRX53928.1 S-adenosyl-l-methionine hydroxide adenosyltransferase family protein [Thalassomonas sp. M1454]
MNNLKKLSLSLSVAATMLVAPMSFAQSALVFQSDFGDKDGAVSAMKGVSVGVDASLPIYDLTHEVPTFNIWEASYRLFQASKYWPEGTVFVSVVDPGVGTPRKSVVLKTKAGYYFVTPDNGTLTMIAEHQGIAEVREIDEKVNRLAGSADSYTFHGRDVYAYTGARLAAGAISFEEVGPKLPNQVVSIDYQHATVKDSTIDGNIPILDPQFGNVWTNIHQDLLKEAGIKLGDTLCVTVKDKDETVLDTKLPYLASFGKVNVGEPLIYVNSLLNVSLALNQSNFAAKHNIASGADWTIKFKECN